jgi:hypothetical protein
VGLISKLLSLLGTAWSNKFVPFALIYGLMKRMGLVYPMLFLVLVFPSLIGTFAYLSSEGLHPLLAVIATVGIQFGGQFIEVWNAFWQIQAGVSLVEGAVIVLGASTSILRLLWYYYIWNWISDNAEPTVSNISKFVVATIILGMATGFALLVDVYVLPSSSHLSGYTYVFSNPEIILDPLAQVFGQAPAPEPTGALNSTVNNTTVGG